MPMVLGRAAPNTARGRERLVRKSLRELGTRLTAAACEQACSNA